MYFFVWIVITLILSLLSLSPSPLPFCPPPPPTSLHLCLTATSSTSLPSSLQDELQEPFGVPGLAVLPVPAHHRHLCPGAVGKVHLQLRPLLRHRHGDLHLICLCAHPREARTGIFLWDLWRPAWEHHGTHELNEGEEEAAAGWISMKSPNHFLLGSQSTSLHHVHPQPQRSVTSCNQDWKHEDLHGAIWKSEAYYLLYIPNPLALPHGIRHSTLHHFHTLAVKRLVKCCLSSFSFIDFFSTHMSCVSAYHLWVLHDRVKCGWIICMLVSIQNRFLFSSWLLSL